MLMTSWLLRIVYNFFFCLLLPFILFKLHTSGSGGRGFGKRWREHFGFIPPVHADKPLWIHAASVGEVIVAKPLIQALRAKHPELTLVLTTTTRTGADEAAKLGDWITHRYAPLDCPWMVRLFLRRTRPQALLVIETERWLNYMLACQRQQITVVIVNARLSPRSFQRYQRFPAFFRLWAEPVQQLLVQHADDAARFRALGVPETKLHITGSIKFDMTFPDSVVSQGVALREAWGSRPVWIAASTHQGEDEPVLQAFKQVLAQMPAALLVLVPRHPQRFDAVAGLCASQGFSAVRRSTAGQVLPTTQVYIGDTMGELPLMLAAADVAFVGGSLVSVGGHNLLEPAALGKPCLTGPHYFNFSDITQQLVQRGGAVVVQDAEALAVQVLDLLQNPAACQRMGGAAQQVVAANRGALQRTLQALEKVLP